MNTSTVAPHPLAPRRSDELGSAAQFERLHVRADGVWRRFTVLGRPGENGRRVLVEVAHEVLASA